MAGTDDWFDLVLRAQLAREMGKVARRRPKKAERRPLARTSDHDPLWAPLAKPPAKNNT